MINLSWDEFKHGDFAIQCVNESANADFFDKVKKTDIDYYTIDFDSWTIFNKRTCYIINSNNQLDVCHKDYCNYNNIPVIEWKMWQSGDCYDQKHKRGLQMVHTY